MPNGSPLVNAFLSRAGLTKRSGEVGDALDAVIETHVTAAFLFGYKRLRAAHDEWHPCASQPLSWLKRVYSITSEQQLTGPLLPICRRNIQMSKSMRIRSGYKMGISIPLPESRLALISL